MIPDGYRRSNEVANRFTCGHERERLIIASTSRAGTLNRSSAYRSTSGNDELIQGRKRKLSAHETGTPPQHS